MPAGSTFQASEMIYDALRIIRFSRAGQVAGLEVRTDGLAVLNRLIDTLNLDRGSIFEIRRDTFTLVGGTQSYTVGVGGTFNTTRPIDIENVNVLYGTGLTQIHRTCRVLTQKQWAAKKFLGSTGIPYELYNDAAYPLATWSFYPIPDTAYTIETYTSQQFAGAALLTTTLQVPPGYYEYWLYSLAQRLAPMLAGAVFDDAALDVLMSARAGVRASNALSPDLSTNELDPRGGGMYNWLDGVVETE